MKITRIRLFFGACVLTLVFIVQFFKFGDTFQSSVEEKVKNRIDQLKNHTYTLAHFCRHKEIIQVPVQNNVTVFPCRTDRILNAAVQIFKITPNSTHELVPTNDSRILEYDKEFGVRFNISEDLKISEASGQNFTYSCELKHPDATHTFINISLVFDEKFVYVEPECKVPFFSTHQENLSADKFYCFALNLGDSEDDTTFKWFESLNDGAPTPINQTLEDSSKQPQTFGTLLRSENLIKTNNLNLTGVVCQVSRKKLSGISSGNYSLNIKKAEPPEILDKEVGAFRYNEKGLKHTCIFRGRKGTKIKWLKNDQQIFGSHISTKELSMVGDQIYVYSNLKNLVWTDAEEDATYTCVVNNSIYTDTKTFYVRRRNWKKNIFLGILPVLPFAIMFLLAYKYLMSLRWQKRFLDYLKQYDPNPEKSLEFANYKPDEVEQIGQGEFGEICKFSHITNHYNAETGAVTYVTATYVYKTTKWTLCSSEKQARFICDNFLSEIRLIQELFATVRRDDDRLNYIVKYIAWAAPSPRNFKVFLILEYCEHGDLLQYLKNCTWDNLLCNNTKPFLLNDIVGFSCNHARRRMTEESLLARNTHVLALSHLMKFIEQIAFVLTYLEEQNIGHRDLALRNILLKQVRSSSPGENIHDLMVAKISDFGLARKLNDSEGKYVIPEEENQSRGRCCRWFQNSNHESDKPRNLPVHWYPLEALDNLGYTIKSDIWSFGILVWEIFQAGRHAPYGEFPVQRPLDLERFMSYLRANGRLSQPCGEGESFPVPSDIWTILLNCWDNNPNSRGSFQSIHEQLQDINNAYIIYERNPNPNHIQPVPEEPRPEPNPNAVPYVMLAHR